jgi:hypothetical protein
MTGSRLKNRIAALGGFVYFIQVQGNAGDYTGCIKIGFTRGSAVRRRYELQTGSVLDLLPILSAPADPTCEVFLHEAFEAHRVRSVLKPREFRGEWFYPAAPVLELIAQVRESKCLNKAILDRWKQKMPAVDVRAIVMPRTVPFTAGQTRSFLLPKIIALVEVDAKELQRELETAQPGVSWTFAQTAAQFGMLAEILEAQGFKRVPAHQLDVEAGYVYGDDPWERILHELGVKNYPKTTEGLLREVLKATPTEGNSVRLRAVEDARRDKQEALGGRRGFIYRRKALNAAAA